MVAKDDPAWNEWDAAIKRVNSAAAALRELSGQSQKRKDVEEELEDALDALEEAADKITSDDDDD
jgi:hypothetical protein